MLPIDLPMKMSKVGQHHSASSAQFASRSALHVRDGRHSLLRRLDHNLRLLRRGRLLVLVLADAEERAAADLERDVVVARARAARVAAEALAAACR